MQLNGFGCNPSGPDTEQEGRKPNRKPSTHRCSVGVNKYINYIHAHDVVLLRFLQLSFTVCPYMIMQPCHEDPKLAAAISVHAL